MKSSRRYLALLCAVLGGARPAPAQIVADPAAAASQRPTVLADEQGRPRIDIQTPTQAGLSHNIYQQFDVAADGVVLNNSASNPLLAPGVHATTILNEVNAANPSKIHGAITVEGHAAEVIVANPNGIHVDGGSFVNTTRATLTTGTPLMRNGALTGFDVRGDGVITIGPGGLDNEAVPSTDLLARAVTVAGALKARILTITASGADEPGAWAEDAGTLAIDTRALGSMYANTIVIQANERGADIRNAGTWQAVAGPIVVTAQGAIRNEGSIVAQTATLAASGGGDIVLGGRIDSTAADGQIRIDADGALDARPGTSLNAGGDVWLHSGAKLSAANAAFASDQGRVVALGGAGLDLINSTVTGRQVHLESGEPFQATSVPLSIEGGRVRGETRTTVLASQDVRIASPGITSVGSGGDLDIHAAEDISIAPGTALDADGDLRIDAGTDLALQGAPFNIATASKVVSLTAGANLYLSGASVSSNGAQLRAGQNLEIQAHNGHGHPQEVLGGLSADVKFPSLTAAGNVRVSSHGSDLLASGLQAPSRHSAFVSDGSIRVTNASDRRDVAGQYLSSPLAAQAELLWASIDDELDGHELDVVPWHDVRILASKIDAGGNVNVFADDSIYLAATSELDHGKDFPGRNTVTAGSLAIRGRAVDILSSELRSTGSGMPGAKSGDVSITATSDSAHFGTSTQDSTRISSTGTVALHASTDLIHRFTQVTAHRGISNTSAAGQVTGTEAKLTADGPIIFASKGSQSHDGGLYQGQAVSISNEAGHLALNRTAVRAVGSPAATAGSPSGRVNIHSGGTLSVDAASVLVGPSALVIKQAQGDIVINPVNATRGTLALTQLSTQGNVTLETVQGNLVVAGSPSSGDPAQTTEVVAAEIGGDMALKGANVTLQGSALKTGGAMNIEATTGDLKVRAQPNVITEGEQTSTSWEFVKLSGATALNLRAAGNVELDGVYATSDGHANVQAGTSGSGSISNLNATIVNKGALRLSSKGAQAHKNCTYHAGAVSILNEAGQLALDKTSVRAPVADAAPLDSVLGIVNLESGGTMRIAPDSEFWSGSELSIVQGEGDVVLNPPTEPRGTLALNQIAVNGAATVGTRHGNMYLTGHPNQGPQRQLDRVVSVDMTGNLKLFANNITMQGSVLHTTGAMYITATGGDLSFQPVRRDQPDGGLTSTGWNPTDLVGLQGLTLQATGNIHSGLLSALTDGQLNILAGGSVTSSSEHVHDLKDDRPAGGWSVDEYFPSRSMFQGTAGIHIAALGGNLSINDANLEAREGPITLRAMGGLDLRVGEERRRREAVQHGGSTQHFLIFRKSHEWTNHLYGESLRNEPVTLKARDIEVKAGGSINTYATRFNSDRNVTITAGDSIQYYAVHDQNKETTQHDARSHWGLPHMLEFRSGSDSNTNESSILTPQPAVLQSEQDILSQSGGDQLLQGTQVHYGGTATFQAGVGETARADARVILEGVKGSIAQARTETSDSVVWERTASSGTVKETLTLPSFEGPTAPVINAPGGLDVQVPEGDLKKQIETLSEQPGMRHLQSLASRPDVNWRPVKVAFDQWDYSHEGLTPAGAALVAVAVGWALGPGGVGLIGAGTTPMAVMANASLASLASQATIALINHRGDLGATMHALGTSDTVKATLAAALTAGAADKLGGTPQFARLANGSVPEKFAFNVGISGGRALTRTAIQGGSLEDALRQTVVGGVVDTAHGHAASVIKELESNHLAHTVAHALAGAAAGKAAGGKWEDGALGATVGELVAQSFTKPGADASAAEIAAFDAKVLGYASLFAGTAAAYGGGDAQTAITTAETAVRNNYLTAAQKRAKREELASCLGALCKAGVHTRYEAMSDVQDVALVSGIAGGIAEQSMDQTAALIQLALHPRQTLESLSSIVNDAEFRAAVGTQIADDFRDRIDRQVRAYEDGGWDGAIASGREAGRLAVDIASAATGLKAATALTAATAKVAAGSAKATAGFASAMIAHEMKVLDANIAKGHIFDRSGRPIMDFKALSTGEKQLIGEARADSFVMRKIPDAIKLTKEAAVGSNGIDAIYKVNHPEIDYIIVESKFGTSTLKHTKDGLQMSDSWLRSDATNANRIFRAVRDSNLTDEISTALREGRVEKWLTRVSPHGNVTIQVLDSAGKPLSDPVLASKFLGKNK